MRCGGLSPYPDGMNEFDVHAGRSGTIRQWSREVVGNSWALLVLFAEAAAVIQVTGWPEALPGPVHDFTAKVPWQLVAFLGFFLASFEAFHRVRMQRDYAKVWGTFNFETLETIGELGEAFDTSGREADRLLIECARLFIEREGLTNTDPESLALIAIETPALRERLIALQDDL
jgi:hypothetical protein